MLIVFFIVVVLVIPGYFHWYFTQEKKGPGGVDRRNAERFAALIDESMMGTVIPGILCQSIELSKMKVNNQGELDAFKALKQR